MTEIKFSNATWVWLAVESKKGFRLKVELKFKQNGKEGKIVVPVSGIYFETEKEVKKFVKGNVVFIHRAVKVTKKEIFNK